MSGIIPGVFRPTEEPGDDALAYLRRSRTLAYSRGAVIFREGDAADSLYLVIRGTVAVSRHTGSGSKLLIEIYTADEFFGESALVSDSCRPEEVEVLEDATVMQWSVEEIRDSMLREPLLGMALLKVIAQRGLDFVNRIEILASESIPQRLARSLIRFCRLGVVEEQGAVRMPRLTHELIAQHVGTSREVVTLHMNQFRRQKLLSYSRSGIVVWRGRLESWLAQSMGKGESAGASNVRCISE